MKELRRRAKIRKEGQKEAEKHLTWERSIFHFQTPLQLGCGHVDPVGGNKMETDYFSNEERQNSLTHSFSFSPSSWHLATQRIKVSYQRWWTKKLDGVWIPGNLISQLPSSGLLVMWTKGTPAWPTTVASYLSHITNCNPSYQTTPLWSDGQQVRNIFWVFWLKQRFVSLWNFIVFLRMCVKKQFTF